MHSRETDTTQFEQQTEELMLLGSVLQTLSWDQETMMPSQGGSFRAKQISALSAFYHQKLIDPSLGALLERLQDTDLELWLQTSVREIKRQRNKAIRLPEQLVRNLAETTSLAYAAWVQAREQSDWSQFAPWLEKIIRLKREEARYLQKSDVLYDALLDHYEPDMTTQVLDTLFAVLRPRLTELLNQIQASEKQPNSHLLKGSFPASKQRDFGHQVLSSMGFQWEAGRLDRSPHPFCTGLSPSDVRITTRYSEDDFSSSLFGIIHEGGHALYEQGLGSHHYGSAACDAISLGIHESQSRLWENQVGRSRAFWEYWFTPLKDTFPGKLDHLSIDSFVRAINRVEASLIRVEADEVSYGLHIILRYELEKLMIEGDLEVSDLEMAWNTKIEEYLGIIPSNAAEGVLQDIHWAHGSLGYFPTYLLGNLYAAQIFHQAKQTLPALEDNIRNGQLIPLREWLCTEIHQRAKTVTAEDLIQDLTGSPLSPHYFLDYLEKKFGDLYELRKF
ncbi:MAG: carboxypeptidase M32 [Acidobacteriota bacterium]|nr:carboxypeptidase M32 [Acidobacteriota bacterium]